MAPGVDVARGVVLDDRYCLDDVIGQGGMATVYRAHDRVLDRHVAIKLFPPATEDADDVLRHQAEMRVLAQLSHPGLVTLHDAGSAYAGGPMKQTYLVMELVHGPTLAEKLTGGPLPRHHAALVGRQVAEALAAVHAADVVHRDIKPANVLLVDQNALEGTTDDVSITTGPIVKLADFGIARLSDGARLTVTGTTLGTATYLSPEQAAGATVAPPTDVYALGLVLLECLTGRKAFTGTIVEVAAARLNTSPSIPADLGSDWAALLAGMTRRDPDERPSAVEVARRLTLILEGKPAADESTSPRRRALRRAAALVSPAEPGSAPAAGPEGGGPHEGTRQYSTAEIQAAAERFTQEALGPPSIEPGAGRRAKPARRPTRAALVAVAVVAIGAAAAVAGSSAGPEEVAPQPPAYPSVDGPLGSALEALQRSVEP